MVPSNISSTNNSNNNNNNIESKKKDNFDTLAHANTTVCSEAKILVQQQQQQQQHAKSSSSKISFLIELAPSDSTSSSLLHETTKTWNNNSNMKNNSAINNSTNNDTMNNNNNNIDNKTNHHHSPQMDPMDETDEKRNTPVINRNLDNTYDKTTTTTNDDEHNQDQKDTNDTNDSCDNKNNDESDDHNEDNDDDNYNDKINNHNENWNDLETNGNNFQTATSSTNEIQSVAIVSLENRNEYFDKSMTATTTSPDSTRIIWCAVTRHDKTLSLYKIDLNDERIFSVVNSTTLLVTKEQTTSTNTNICYIHQSIRPTTVHRTSKRAGSLCFATVPPPPDEEIHLYQPNQSLPLPVIIAGDLAGDAVAFSLEISSKVTPDGTISSTPEKDATQSKYDTSAADDPALDISTGVDDEENEHKVATATKRLLLGHTASMITGVHVLPWHGDKLHPQYIVTSDRDEKVRVSAFPDTHTIVGFLLGHTSFISSIDCCCCLGDDKESLALRCVSMSGDHTIRVWDCKTCRPLAMASWASASTNMRAPLRVAINCDGDTIATIYDDCTNLDLWTLTSKETDEPIHSTNTTPDNDTLPMHLKRAAVEYSLPAQPLAIQFLNHDTVVILLRNPHFLRIYKIQPMAATSGDGMVAAAAASLKLVDTTIEYPMCELLARVATEASVVLPESLLERDPRNQKIKLQKPHEERGGSQTKPWNNVSRKDTAKERNRRMRQRKRQRRT